MAGVVLRPPPKIKLTHYQFEAILASVDEAKQLNCCDPMPTG